MMDYENVQEGTKRIATFIMGLTALFLTTKGIDKSISFLP